MNFTNISNEIISNKNISDGAFKLYTVLSMYCYGDKDACRPSQKTLADIMGKSIRTIQRYLKELAGCGLIKIFNRGHLSNIYQILKKIILNPAAKKAKETVKKIRNKGHFNDYEQRQYNYDELERKLLGWE